MPQLAAIAKVKAAEVGIKTDVSAKTLFDKHPNADKLLVLQMLASTYCSILAQDSALTVQQQEQAWSKFQERLLAYALPTPEAPSANAQAELLRTVLQPLYFRVGSVDLLPESRERLQEYATRMKALPLSGIVLEGHTHPVDVQPNMNLSRMRAEAVRKELVTLGIEAAKIQAVGVGGRAPVAAGANAYNSRVVIKILP